MEVKDIKLSTSTLIQLGRIVLSQKGPNGHVSGLETYI